MAVSGEGPICTAPGFPPSREPDLRLQAALVDDALALDSTPISDCDTWEVHRDGERISFVVKAPTWDPPEVARVDLDEGADRGVLLIRRGLEANPIDYPLDQLLAIHVVHRKGGVLLHAACVARGDGAYIVAGPSGAGKTTFARSVAGRSDVTILTDERVVLRRTDRGWLASGTPWVGEGGFASNTTRPLRGIFLLEHSDTDELVALSPVRAMARLIGCHFPPTWMGEDPEVHFGALDQLARDIPCYLLRNRLGGDAPALVFSTQTEAAPGEASPMTSRRGRGAVTRSLLESGRPVTITAFGSSMAPAIRSGDVVELEPVSVTELRVGQVVLVDCGGRLRLHRVVSLRPLVTRGDSSSEPDGPIDSVLGRVARVDRRSWLSLGRGIVRKLTRMLWYNRSWRGVAKVRSG